LRFSLGRGGRTDPPQTGGHHRYRGNTACELVHAGMDTGASYVIAQQTLALRWAIAGKAGVVHPVML
jgi:hypothetical protein